PPHASSCRSTCDTQTPWGTMGMDLLHQSDMCLVGTPAFPASPSPPNMSPCPPVLRASLSVEIAATPARTLPGGSGPPHTYLPSSLHSSQIHSPSSVDTRCYWPPARSSTRAPAVQASLRWKDRLRYRRKFRIPPALPASMQESAATIFPLSVRTHSCPAAPVMRDTSSPSLAPSGRSPARARLP